MYKSLMAFQYISVFLVFIFATYSHGYVNLLQIIIKGTELKM